MDLTATSSSITIPNLTSNNSIAKIFDFLEDYNNDINDALEFPSYMRYVTTGLCVLLLILGIVGNMLVPIVVYTNKELRNSTNYFLVNLSVADLLVMIVCMPTVLIELHTLPEVWILGEMMCKLVPFLEMIVAHGSILTILAITFERYYAICRPLMAGYTCTKMRAVAIILAIWIIATLITCPIIFITDYGYAMYIDGSRKPACTVSAYLVWHKIYFFSVTVLLFFVPLFILVILYGIIAKRLMTTQKCLASPVPDPQIKARKQVIFMLAAVVACFFLCLLPFRIFTIWLLLASSNEIKNIGMEAYYNMLYFCRVMLYTNSAINPILYNLISSRFREAFLRLLLCKHGRSLKRQPTLTTSYTTYASYESLKAKQKTICLPLNNINGISYSDKKKGEIAV